MPKFNIVRAVDTKGIKGNNRFSQDSVSPMTNVSL